MNKMLKLDIKCKGAMLMKKVISVFLAALMLFSFNTAFVFATDTVEKGNYPFVMVHGLGGWGQYDKVTENFPYWGGGAAMEISNGDIIKFLNESGYEAYATSVGPVSSAWDRACELYAQLTGTVVDYGKAHSEKCGHDRYGDSFEGRALMGEEWDGESPLNLVGHSFGGPTIRLFTSLMAFGDEDELAASGEDASPLFKGGKGGAVHSVVTLSGCHNGVPFANLIVDTKVPMYAIAFLINTMSALNLKSPTGSIKLGHFGLTAKTQDDKVYLSGKKIANFVKSQDNAGVDLTVGGSQKLNEKIKMSPETYYYSYAVYVTEETKLGFLKMGETAPIFALTGLMTTKIEGMTIDGIKMDRQWAMNDGLVPLASALYPLDEKDNALLYEKVIENDENLKPAVWYYKEPIYGMDHGDFCNVGDDYPTTAEDFYLDMAQMADRIF